MQGAEVHAVGNASGLCNLCHIQDLKCPVVPSVHMYMSAECTPDWMVAMHILSSSFFSVMVGL